MLRLRITFHVPYAAWALDANIAVPRFFDYLKSLAEMEPSFGEVYLPGKKPLADLDVPPPRMAGKFEQDQFVSSFDNGKMRGGRAFRFSGGSPRNEYHDAHLTRIDLMASPDLMSQSERITALMEHGIAFWEATDAFIVNRVDQFWLRWLRDGAEVFSPNIPLTSDWSERREVWGGTLYVWPENEPVKLIDADRAALIAEGITPEF